MTINLRESTNKGCDATAHFLVFSVASFAVGFLNENLHRMPSASLPALLPYAEARPRPEPLLCLRWGTWTRKKAKKRGVPSYIHGHTTQLGAALPTGSHPGVPERE